MEERIARMPFTCAHRTGLITRALFALCLQAALQPAQAQGTEAAPLDRPPRFHLSVGSERLYLEAPNAVEEDGRDGTGTARYSAMVRLAGRWSVGASYFQYGTRGLESRTDSSRYIPPHYTGDPFFGWLVPGHTEVYGDVASVRQWVNGYELFAGATFPSRWPRRRFHVTGSAFTGVRLYTVREEHGYIFNTVWEGKAPFISGTYDTTTTVHGNAWAWLLRLRIDLHCTRYASLFTELNAVQQVYTPSLGSSATQANGTLQVSDERDDLSGTGLSLGVALHL